jgi:hypothetical protein
MARTSRSPHYDYVGVAWPRIMAVLRVFQANMDTPHAIGRPLLGTQLRAPVRFPGVPPQRTSSLITVQSRLRGLPYFDALTLNNAKLAHMNLTTQSPPPVPFTTPKE